MPGYMPLGSLPDPIASLGYQLLAGSPRERMTDTGMEAQLTFAGPSENRFKFISQVFGTWAFNVEEGVCCAVSTLRPKCYSMFYNNVAGGSYSDNLWPDTFDMRPMNDPSPLYYATTAPSLDPGDPNYRPQIEWGVAYTCPTEITINYRSKRMANSSNPNPVLAQPWPDFLYQLNQCSPGAPASCTSDSMPLVQDYTYIDFNMRSEADYITIPGRNMEYDTTGWPGGLDNKLPEDVNTPVRVATADVEVVWSNVPLPNWDMLESNKGKVNSVPMWGYPDEAILFEGYEYTAQRTWYNLDVYTIRMKFTFKTGFGNVGSYPCFNRFGMWNRRWSTIPDGTTYFRKVKDTGTNAPPYATADMTDMFKFPAVCGG